MVDRPLYYDFAKGKLRTVRDTVFLYGSTAWLRKSLKEISIRNNSRRFALQLI